jgi:DNA-binding transcriptional regulator YhcF (GntR family)
LSKVETNAEAEEIMEALIPKAKVLGLGPKDLQEILDEIPAEMERASLFLG